MYALGHSRHVGRVEPLASCPLCSESDQLTAWQHSAASCQEATSIHFPLERPVETPTFNLAKARERRPSPVLLLIAGGSGNEPLAKDFPQLTELCIDGVHRALGRDNLRLRDDMS